MNEIIATVLIASMGVYSVTFMPDYDKAHSADSPVVLSDDSFLSSDTPFAREVTRDIAPVPIPEPTKTAPATIQASTPKKVVKIVSAPVKPVISEYNINFDCVARKVTKKIEFHYTAETYDDQPTEEAKLHAIWNAHTSPNGRVQGSGIGYHYIIAQSGHIYATRPIDCVGIADAEGDLVQLEDWEGTSHNAERIHISFIGSDKPNQKQTDSMVYLADFLAKKYHLTKQEITSHAEEAQKSKKESFDYWYGEKNNFLKKLSIQEKPVKIYRKGQNLPWLQHGWNISGGDWDFINTIEQESRWDLLSVGDNGDAFGLCQFNKNWHADKIAKYKALSENGKVEYCYEQYKKWVADGVIANQLHGWKKRNSVKANTFIFK